MVCGLVVSNELVYIGASSPAPGARLKTDKGNPYQSLSRHAEMDALRYLRRHPDVRKARLVVGRLKCDDGWTIVCGNSRPCLHCIHRIIRFHPNIVAVEFFNGGKWITERPETCAKAAYVPPPNGSITSVETCSLVADALI